MTVLDRIQSLCSAHKYQQAERFARDVCLNQSLQRVTVDDHELEVTVETPDFVGVHSIRSSDDPVVETPGTYQPKCEVDLSFTVHTVMDSVQESVNDHFTHAADAVASPSEDIPSVSEGNARTTTSTASSTASEPLEAKPDGGRDTTTTESTRWLVGQLWPFSRRT